MKITIELETENAAFEDEGEMERILKKMRQMLHQFAKRAMNSSMRSAASGPASKYM